MALNSTFWQVKIRAGGIVFNKGMRVTPTSKDVHIDKEFVLTEVRRQQKTWMHRIGRTALPEGEIIYCEPRDPAKPRPAHTGHWEGGGILLDLKDKRI